MTQGQQSRPLSALLVTSAVSGFAILGDSLLYSALPLYAESLGIPLAAVGLLLSINRWIRLLSNSVAVHVFDAIGLFAAVLLAALLSVLATVSYAFTPALPLFLLMRGLWGFCWSHLRLGCYLVVIATAGNHIGKAMGVMHAVVRIGSAMAVIVGGLLLDHFGYRTGLLITAALSALAIPLLIRYRHLLPDVRPPDAVDKDTQSSPHSGKVAAANTHPLPMRLCYLIGFANTFVQAGVIVSTIALIVRDRFDPGGQWFGITVGVATVSGLLLTVHWLTPLLLGPTIGSWSDRLGRSRLFVSLAIIQCGALCGVAFTAGMGAALVAIPILLIAGNAMLINTEAAMADSTELEKAPVYMSRYATFSDLGAAAGPILAYAIGHHLGFTLVYAGAAAIYPLLILLWWLTNRSPESEA